ncbi:glycosyltransferase family 4 protein [Nodosilinea sp. E11]|uniref:glycosyltransferase family 4 protein n=1 Tax=Nodosilinea sp. E11 TaxID=3037479 RepID=UPI0029348998|nr:glycosyltransferase family 4 protein [Nodosilinea sp. E11]WOD37411.1 glycosyltransferase family 4 protein [Nodosilinea sp. E11]
MSLISTFDNMKIDVLMVSRTFLPMEGGIEEYVYNRCLQDPDRIVVLAANCPGADEFDRLQPFLVYRWPNPKILKKILFGGLIKQFICLFWSFVISIKLYQKHRYQYLEWGHGYDFLSLLILGYLLPIKYIVYLHGNDLLCPLKNSLLKSVFSLTLKRASCIVCNSSFTKEYLTSNFLFLTPVQVINPGVRPEKFGLSFGEYPDPVSVKAVRYQCNIPDHAILILSVGRLVKRKGFDRMIAQLPALVDKGLDVHYLVCGRGAMEGELQELAQQLGMGSRVHFAGYVPDVELGNYYAACDVFAMLTFFDATAASIEGFGIVYVEAGFFGKPVIASRVGGVVDAVHHLQNGLLVEPTSPTDLLDALSQLCADADLRERLGKTGQAFAKRQPSYQALYPSVISA